MQKKKVANFTKMQLQTGKDKVKITKMLSKQREGLIARQQKFGKVLKQRILARKQQAKKFTPGMEKASDSLFYSLNQYMTITRRRLKRHTEKGKVNQVFWEQWGHFLDQPVSPVTEELYYGLLYKRTKWNIFLAIVDNHGKVISLATAGSLGITHKPHKVNHVAVYQLARRVGREAARKGVLEINFFRKVGGSRLFKASLTKGLADAKVPFAPTLRKKMQERFGYKRALVETGKAVKAGLVTLQLERSNKLETHPVSFFLKKAIYKPHNGTRPAKPKTVKKHYAPKAVVPRRQRKRRFSSIFSLMRKVRVESSRFQQLKRVGIAAGLVQHENVFLSTFYTRRLYTLTSWLKGQKKQAEISTFRDKAWVRLYQGYQTQAAHLWAAGILDKQLALELNAFDYQIASHWTPATLTLFRRARTGFLWGWRTGIGTRFFLKPAQYLHGSGMLLPFTMKWSLLKHQQYSHEKNRHLRLKQQAEERKQKQQQKQKRNQKQWFSQQTLAKKNQGQKPWWWYKKQKKKAKALKQQKMQTGNQKLGANKQKGQHFAGKKYQKTVKKTYGKKNKST